MKKLIILFIAVAGFGVSSFGQVSATATSSATIVTPIGITKTVDMNFGNVAVSNVLGTVVLTPAGTRTKSGGVTLPATAGTVSAASFAVVGEGNYTYAITLPSSAVTLKRTGSVDTMTATLFSSTPSGTGALTGGAEALLVGATLNVAGSQLAGTYTTEAGSPFTVTVNYN